MDNVYIIIVGKGFSMAYHHGNLRDALIKAAIPLLAKKGVSGLSLREVARAVGVGHAAPYRHFKNKRELIESIAAVGFNKLAKGCVLAEKKYPNDPEKQLSDGGVRYLTFAYENPEITNVMFGGFVALGDCGEELSSAAEQAMGHLVKLISNGQRAGIYRNDDVMDLTLAAWSSVHGLSMLVISGMLGDSASSKNKTIALGEKVSELLMQGLLKPS